MGACFAQRHTYTYTNILNSFLDTSSFSSKWAQYINAGHVEYSMVIFYVESEEVFFLPSVFYSLHGICYSILLRGRRNDYDDNDRDDIRITNGPINVKIQ